MNEPCSRCGGVINLSHSRVEVPAADLNSDWKAEQAKQFVGIPHETDLYIAYTHNEVNMLKKYQDIIESTADLEVCYQCSGSFGHFLNDKVQEAEKEYENLLFLQSEIAMSQVDYMCIEEGELDAEIQTLKEREAVLIKVLEAIEHKKKLEFEAEREAKLSRKEELQVFTLWSKINEFELEKMERDEKEIQQKVKYEFYNDCLQADSNVLDELFQISIKPREQPISSINSLRLGRLPSIPVEYEEINAAWGQCALLLYTLADKQNFSFTNFEIIPLGGKSELRRKDDGTYFQLYDTYSYKFTQLFYFSSFDNAMVEFLKCLKEYADFVKKKYPSFVLPFNIDGDVIGEYSIKQKSDVEWTKALTCLLCNLKALQTQFVAVYNKQ